MRKLRLHENDVNTANLYLRESALASIGRLKPAIINITDRFMPERQRVENFIRDVYARSYSASINVDYPTLMSIRNEQGEILAAAGFRYAAREPLFLECYTGAPIETLLNRPRTRIVEVGNLASAGGGASLFLFIALASYLNFKNIEYAVATGTDSLHRSFRKLGLEPEKLCDASAEGIGNGNQSWGSYYDSAPRVLAGSVRQGAAKLKTMLDADFHELRPRLYPRLHHKI